MTKCQPRGEKIDGKEFNTAEVSDSFAKIISETARDQSLSAVKQRGNGFTFLFLKAYSYY